MRPPEFTGGNTGRRPRTPLVRFRFNEAAGIHRRKRGHAGPRGGRAGNASMRPPEFTGGNVAIMVALRVLVDASMRPPEFTGGNMAKSDAEVGPLALQ